MRLRPGAAGLWRRSSGGQARWCAGEGARAAGCGGALPGSGCGEAPGRGTVVKLLPFDLSLLVDAMKGTATPRLDPPLPSRSLSSTANLRNGVGATPRSLDRTRSARGWHGGPGGADADGATARRRMDGMAVQRRLWRGTCGGCPAALVERHMWRLSSGGRGDDWRGGCREEVGRCPDGVVARQQRLVRDDVNPMAQWVIN